jgi:insulysin
MLFMGSEEFPGEGDFDRYITAHAGGNNAWTASDHTLYYFNILPQGLLGALDRLSQFFTSPVCLSYTFLT